MTLIISSCRIEDAPHDARWIPADVSKASNNGKSAKVDMTLIREVLERDHVIRNVAGFVWGIVVNYNDFSEIQ